METTFSMGPSARTGSANRWSAPLMLAVLGALCLNGCLVISDGGGGRPPSSYAATLPSYEPCANSSECRDLNVTCQASGSQDGRRSSYQTTCTISCQNDNQCPPDLNGYGGRCVKFGGAGLCHQSCRYHADCPSGFDCVDHAGVASFPPVCLPRS